MRTEFNTAAFERIKAQLAAARSTPHKPEPPEVSAKKILEMQGEPTLADKLAEASRAANITAEGGG